MLNWTNEVEFFFFFFIKEIFPTCLGNKEKEVITLVSFRRTRKERKEKSSYSEGKILSSGFFFFTSSVVSKSISHPYLIFLYILQISDRSTRNMILKFWLLILFVTSAYSQSLLNFIYLFFVYDWSFRLFGLLYMPVEFVRSTSE